MNRITGFTVRTADRHARVGRQIGPALRGPPEPRKFRPRMFGQYTTSKGHPNYYYGENVYYSDNSVYYRDQSGAAGEQYAAQVEPIVQSHPVDMKPQQVEWMPLGVFALTADSQQAVAKANPPVRSDTCFSGIFDYFNNERLQS